MNDGKLSHVDELEHIHKVLLGLMLDFDELCKKNDIHYFLGGGTLLGAVRHGGFIPWDDDVDVMMLREDYNKLCNLPSEAFPSHLFLQTRETDPYYHGDMAKIRLNGTQYCTEFSQNFSNMHNGFFIDIFAHDKTSKNVFRQKTHIFLTRFFRSAVFHKWENTPMQFYGKHKIICKIATCVNRILPISILEQLREQCYTWYDKTDSEYLYDGMGQHLSHGVFPKKWLNGSVEILFESYHFPAPKEYEKYLTFSYGDYMKIPKESERVYHKIAHIDYGKY